MSAIQQATGATAETDFETSLTQYRLLGLATGQRNYPEIVQNGFRATVIGKASTDFTAFITGGPAIQIEVKTWADKDTHKMSFAGKEGLKLRQQYEMMCDFARFTPTVYLVLWRWQGRRDWRIYPVLSIPQTDNGLLFERERGQTVAEGDGWPEWLEAVGAGLPMFEGVAE